jgi:hypothetical protein
VGTILNEYKEAPMYQDESEAAKWRAYALERERDELKAKLQEQAQEIAALKNQPEKATPQKTEPPIKPRPKSKSNQPSDEKAALAVGSLLLTLPFSFIVFMSLQSSQGSAAFERFWSFLFLFVGASLVLWAVGVFLMYYFSKDQQV